MAWTDKLRVTLRSSAARRVLMGIELTPGATQGQIDTLLAALAGFSKGAVAHATREAQVMDAVATVGAAGDYATHRDVMRLRLLHADGGYSLMTAPIVRETLLEEDTQTLKYGEAAVTALVDALKPIAVNEDGSLVASLAAGWRDYIRSW